MSLKFAFDFGDDCACPGTGNSGSGGSGGVIPAPVVKTMKPAPNTGSLSSITMDTTSFVLVFNNGIYQPLQTNDSPNNTTTFASGTPGYLWVLALSTSGGSGTGTVVEFTDTYIVGVTAGAPAEGTNTWSLAAFANAIVRIFIGGQLINSTDAGDGTPYISKANLASNTITANNYLYSADDKVTAIILK